MAAKKKAKRGKRPTARGARSGSATARSGESTKKATKKAATKTAVKKRSRQNAAAGQAATRKKRSSKVEAKPAGSKKAVAAGADRAGVGEFKAFSQEALEFLVELSANNDRDWFKQNQERYERAVREPTLAFIRAMRPVLAKLSPHVVASDKKVGGSMMRPQRDTRFSSDKAPYKLNVGVQFRHAAGKDVHAPGFYVHFDPNEVFIGVGMWHPEPEALLKVRTLIARDSKRWSKVVGSRAFSKHFRLAGASLKRPPRGFDSEHALIEDLKRKDFIAVCDLPHRALLEGRLVQELARRFNAARDFMKLLHDALGLEF